MEVRTVHLKGRSQLTTEWPIEVQISATELVENKQVESLENWLRLDANFRGRTRLTGTPSEGDLGRAGELLAVAIGSGGVISVLATSLSAWIQQPKKSDITLKVTGPGGATVEIDAKRATPQEVNELLHKALEATQGETE
ncbi:effector-associated constant component EACC1 [Streptomyces sp. NPDC002623]